MFTAQMQSRLTSISTLICIVAFLTACGGGDSSSGGGTQPVADIDRYVGDYSGTLTGSAVLFDGTTRDNMVTLLVTILDNGLIVFSSPDTGPLTQCPDESLFLTSNPLNFSQSFTDCIVAGTTSLCSEDIVGTMSFTGNEIVGSTAGRVTCPEGTITYERAFKVARKASAGRQS